MIYFFKASFYGLVCAEYNALFTTQYCGLTSNIDPKRTLANPNRARQAHVRIPQIYTGISQDLLKKYRPN